MKKNNRKIKWPDARNYNKLCEAARLTPDAVAYKYKGKQVTYKALLSNVDRVAAGIKRLNIKKGDKVIVSLPDIPQAIECLYAIEKESVHECTLPPGVKAAAVAVIADKIECKAIITVNDNYEEIAKAVSALDHPVDIILVDVNLKRPESKISKHILHKKMQKNYAKYEHIISWSELIQT